MLSRKGNLKTDFISDQFITTWFHVRFLQPYIKPCNWKLKNSCVALTGVAQWVGCHPANRKVSISIPGQGTCLGCGPDPWLGLCERQTIDVSLYLFLPPFPISKNKLKNIFYKEFFGKGSSVYNYLFFKKILFIYLERRKRGRGTSMCGCLSCAPYWGPGPQLRHVSYTGNQTSNPLICRLAFNHWATPARAKCL